MKKQKNKRSKRFTSEKSAKSFAKKVDGVLKDLRDYPESKSKFKVTYISDPNREWNGPGDYRTDWNEKNLDGSFAYNGVKDDF